MLAGMSDQRGKLKNYARFCINDPTLLHPLVLMAFAITFVNYSIAFVKIWVSTVMAFRLQ